MNCGVVARANLQCHLNNHEGRPCPYHPPTAGSSSSTCSVWGGYTVSEHHVENIHGPSGRTARHSTDCTPQKRAQRQAQRRQMHAEGSESLLEHPGPGGFITATCPRLDQHPGQLPWHEVLPPHLDCIPLDTCTLEVHIRYPGPHLRPMVPAGHWPMSRARDRRTHVHALLGRSGLGGVLRRP